jgi:transposase-like protein
MQKATTATDSVVQFRLDIQERIRRRIRSAIEEVLEEEIVEALGAGRHERTEPRQGYRHGKLTRRITTPEGARTLRVPRGRIRNSDGSTSEFRSAALPRYARRAAAVDEAILGCYLAGANSRRIRKALEPLFGAEHLSKSAVSRVVGRLKGLFESWNARDLSSESYPVLFLDGFHLKVRIARRVVSVPVLAALGVNKDGQKVLVSLRLAASESAGMWTEVIRDLQKRGLVEPHLIVVDGHAGLNKALEAWPGARVQRCTTHKLRNLLEHCPVHARAEMKRDFHRIVYGKDGLAARAAYDAFVRKWRELCPAVARSIEEGGEELLTFYEFPSSMWGLSL